MTWMTSNRSMILISVVGTRIEKGDSLEIAFKRADQALYDVKNHGKNGWKIV